MAMRTHQYNALFFSIIVLVTLALPVRSLADAGNALDFDGVDDYVELHADLDLPSQGFSIEMWLYPRLPNNQSFISKNNPGGEDDDQFILGFYGNQIHVRLGDNVPTFSTGNSFTNAWHHLAVTIDSSSGAGTSSLVKIYLDGVLQGESTINKIVEDSLEEPWTLGMLKDGDLPVHFYDGQMDEVRIWSYVRSQNEIQETMQKHLSGTESGLLAYYQFDQSAGTSLIDYSVREYTGTLRGGMTDNDWITSKAELSASWIAPPAITDILDTSATVFSTINTESENITITEAGFCWETSPTPTRSDHSVIVDISEGIDKITTELTLLQPGQLYYIRAYAVVDEEISYGPTARMSTFKNVIWVDDDWDGIAPGIDPDGEDGPATDFGTLSFASIKEAVEMAVDRDGVVIKDGLYSGDNNRDIFIDAKSITIRSQNGPKNTVIDCEKSGRAFLLVHTEEVIAPIQIIDGFTITNGLIDKGGAIAFIGVANDSSVTIRNCILKYNQAKTYGGAIYSSANVSKKYGAAILDIENTTFMSNSAIHGGGLALVNEEWQSHGTMPSVQLVNNILTANTAKGQGGALYLGCSNSGETGLRRVHITNSTVIANTSLISGGGVMVKSRGSSKLYSTYLNVANSIFWKNSARGITNQIHLESPQLPMLLDVGYSVLEGGIDQVKKVGGKDNFTIKSRTNIIDKDPLLAYYNDPKPMLNSPAIDSGSSSLNIIGSYLPATDLSGLPREIDGDTDSVRVVDIGANETTSSTEVPQVAVSHDRLIISAREGDEYDIPTSLLLKSTSPDRKFDWSLTFSEDCSWVTTENGSGAIANGEQELILQVDPQGLSHGEYSCVATIEIADYPEQNRVIPITLKVNKEITVCADPAVPADYESIQQAIDNAIDGDTVSVFAGTYKGEGNNEINLSGKEIAVIANGGKGQTIIDLQGTNKRGFIFETLETNKTTLSGFTIINAKEAGAVTIHGASPTIKDCEFIENTQGSAMVIEFYSTPLVTGCIFTGNVEPALGDGGGAIKARYSSPRIIDCIFEDNSSSYYGGAVYSVYSTTTITNSLFSGNVAGTGGAVYSCTIPIPNWQFDYPKAELEIVNSVFSSNSSEGGCGGAVHSFNAKKALIQNSTFYKNETVDTFAGAVCLVDNREDADNHHIINSAFWDNKGKSSEGPETYHLHLYPWAKTSVWSSSFNAGEYPADKPCKGCLFPSAPGFIDENNSNCQLEPGSPLIDAGKEPTELNSDLTDLSSDFRGSLRPIDGNNDGTEEFDIGAYEYSSGYSGEPDGTTKAFRNLTPETGAVLVDYPYSLSWWLRNPFPDNISAIRNTREYTVNLFLLNDEGYRLELLTTSKKTLNKTMQQTESYTFNHEHIGDWHLGIELASDPTQFLLNKQKITITAGEPEEYGLGQPITPPPGAIADKRPLVGELEGDDGSFCYWSTFTKKLYVVGTGLKTVRWYGEDDAEGSPNIRVLVNSIYPEDPQIFIAGSPPVELLPENSPYDVVQMKGPLSQQGEGLSNNTFQMTTPGYTVLLFTDTSTNAEMFFVVRTVNWKNQEFLQEEVWNIGTTIVEPEEIHDDPELNGYVINETAPFDGVGENKAHDRKTRTGPIIPVNKDLTGPYEADPTTEDDMVVVWYHSHNGTATSWPYLAKRYTLKWPDEDLSPLHGGEPVAVKEVVIENSIGSGPLGRADYGNPDTILVYRQPDKEKPGYNPNEEHALLATSQDGNNYEPALFGLRNDLNDTSTSEAYALLKYRDPNSNDDWAIEVYKVVNYGTTITMQATSTMVLNPPYPLSTLYFTPCPGNRPSNANEGHYHGDKNGELYALEPTDDPVILNFSYPLRNDFHYGGSTTESKAGDCIPWKIVHSGETDSRPVDINYTVSWPTEEVPQLHAGETLITAKNGLPEIDGQCSVDILFGDNKVTLFDPLKEFAVGLVALPDDVDLDQLPFHLSTRLSYDSRTQQLKFKGYFDDTMAGEALLLPSIMSAMDWLTIKDLSAHTESDENTTYPFYKAVNFLYDKSNSNNKRGLTSLATENADYMVVESKALSSGAAETTGEVILVFNDCEECSGPVDLKIIEVTCPLYQGEIKVIEPKNVFDNRVTLRHNGDFGGKSDSWDENTKSIVGKPFNWLYCDYDKDGPPPPPPQYTDDAASSPWKVWPTGTTFSATGTNSIEGAVEIVVEGPGDKTLSDKWFITQYQHEGPCGSGPDSWSPWTEPQLYQGWIKRVLAAINLYDQKVEDFHNNEVNTTASMISLTGEEYEGDAALTYNPEYLDSLGLIQFYQTVLNRGRELTVDAQPPATKPASDQQLLLATNRLSDLYMLLGNEAYTDAIDSTIGFGTGDQGEFNTPVTSLFSFQNQVSTLLEEELTLLRGRSDNGVRPYYNRLPWNFTQSDGEVAYQQNYYIGDENGDGEINEDDARLRYPQGHGDAWGYYLSAIKGYYSLLKHPNYTWEPMAEAILLAGVEVSVDYEDERKFALAANAKAKTGAEISDLTYRQLYEEGPEAQLLGYKDDDKERAWGVNEWATRAGQGAYFDWVVGNATLPAEDTEHEGIQRVDRSTVTDLADITYHLNTIQTTMDRADTGLNPLGIAKHAIPFDINPTAIDGGKTHFEQIYSRAQAALNNAVTVFDYANSNTSLLRGKKDSLADFQSSVEAQERDYNSRLIELYGYPYSDDCGPGNLYSSEYCSSGPDIYHYPYVDSSDLIDIPNEGNATKQIDLDITDFGIKRYDDYTPSVVTQTDFNSDGVNIKNVASFNLVSDPYLQAKVGFFIKPEEWVGHRKAQGTIQRAISELILARESYSKAVAEYDNLIDEIEDRAELIELQYNIFWKKIIIQDTLQGGLMTMDSFIVASRTVNKYAQITTTTLGYIKDGLTASIPKNAIISPDNTASHPLIGGILTSFGALQVFSDVTAAVADVTELGLELGKQHLVLVADSVIARLEDQYALKQSLLELENLIREEISLRTEVLTQLQNLQQAAEMVAVVEAEGERLLQERYSFRTKTAGDIQEYRYQDMAFRIFRNDALQKYRAQLDMAGMYTYLAAKAYDYETALLDTDSKAGKQFLSEIVQQRSIGRVVGGEPMSGSGLAGSLKQMWLNFQVLKPQMGFTNPQVETNRFSLREEMLRILGDEDSNSAWQEALNQNYVEDLWSVPEFRRYCRPFASEGFAQPGLVIPFSTTVTSGLNLFGWPLGPGDSYYSASNFATKVRSVGVWFSDYAVSGLAETPRVYLIPVGTDVLRAPDYAPSNLRFWNVIDQKIPQPMPIEETELDENGDWIPLVDTLYDELYEIRRHSDFRAYPDSGWLNESEMSFNSRLIGRSVYNDRWLLIIPGRNLLYDGKEGITRFIDGPETFYGSGERTGKGVTDIKLFFHTYSYSGN